MADALNQSQIDTALKDLPGWRFDEDKLSKAFEFGSFKEALSFIVRVGLEAENLDHHPELFNVYDKVKLSLSTHDAGGKVTQKDVDLARAIEDFSWV